LHFQIKEYAEKAILLNLRGEPRGNAPLIPMNTIIVKKPIVSPSPILISKKKSLPTVKSVVSLSQESVDEKKKDVRQQIKISTTTALASRTAPLRSKPPVITSSTTNSLNNGKVTSLKTRPATAPAIKPNNHPSRTQQLIPILPPTMTKTRAKPPVSNSRRSSTGPSLSSSTSNLQRQSTSTGGSTSSLSSTNTQASIPCVQSDTSTSSSATTTMTLLRSVSNDIIASPISTTNTGKSRIPVRAIPISVSKK
jgi:hypothetical protein